MISRFLKISTFSAQLLFRKCYYFRISNYSKSTFSKHTVLLNSYFFGKNLFRSRYLLRTVPFSEKLVLRNQLHCIYTWKDFPSTIIHFIKYTRGWSDFEILQFFIIENRRQCMNFNAGCVTNMICSKVGSNCGIFKHVFGSKDVVMKDKNLIMKIC